MYYNHLQSIQFNPYNISNYLQTKSIQTTKIEDFQVNTPYITITPNYVMSSVTAEILLEIPQNETILDYFDYLPAIYSSHKKECEENGWEPPTPPTPNKPNCADYEYADDDIIQCNGCFSGNGTLTYRKGDIVVHSCCMSKYDQYAAYRKTAEIEDAVTGKITDVFFGTWNDFDITLVAKAGKGSKFYLHIFSQNQKIDIQQVHLYAFNSEIVLRSNKFGEWRVLSWDELAS